MSDRDLPPPYSHLDNFAYETELLPSYDSMDHGHGTLPDLNRCPCSAACFNYHSRFGYYCSNVGLTEDELVMRITNTRPVPKPQDNPSIEDAEAKPNSPTKLAAIGRAIAGAGAFLIGLIKKGLGNAREEPEKEESEQSGLLCGRRVQNFHATRIPSDSELDFPPYYHLPALE